jgi:hypothetical protein
LKISHQSPRGVVVLQQNMTIGEGGILRVLIEEAIVKLSNWGVIGFQESRSSNNTNTEKADFPQLPPSIQQAI